jgi:crotonobetainyl-CoA:carnitine CoA-transferase CaiB-like acyl-CoA transferase
VREIGGEARRIRVVAVQPGIAGGYACRLLADAGARVSVLVPAGGLWLQGWSTSGASAAAGLLYRHLFEGAVEVPAGAPEVPAVLAQADVVIVDRIRAAEGQADAATPVLPAVDGPVLVDISTFGAHQPASPRPGNEFSLQGACGSMGYRGWPGQDPIAAGGRLGEWAAGAFAALAAVAGLETRRVRAQGVACAVSLFECMACVYDPFEWLRTGFYDPPQDFGQWLDIPSVERVKDGWAGLTCITPAQWRAFVDMTDSEAFRDDPSLELLLGRVKLRERLDEVSGPWLRAHTAEEVLAEAAKRQIPCSPVGNGQTLLDFDHFRERGFYQSAPDGSFQRPASPVIIDGTRLNGRDTPLAQWCALDRPADSVADAAAGSLSGILVLDLGAFWAGPGCGEILNSLGATVVKVEGVSRPDGMRLVAPRGRSIPHWWEYNAIYHGANAGKKAVSIDLSTGRGRDLLLQLAASADVVVENFATGVMDRFGLTYEQLNQRNPRLVMVQMPAFGLSGSWRERRGYATTMDQVSGISWVTGDPSGSPVGAKSFGDFNGSAHAAFATLLALARRANTGKGAHIEVALAEACLAVTADQVIEYSAAGVLVTREGSRRRDAAPQGIYPARDGKWLAISVPSDQAWAAFVSAFDPELPGDPADYATREQRALAADDLDAAVQAVTARYDSAEAVRLLRASGVAAETVVSPSFVDEDPDLVASGFIRSLPHPIHGDLNYVTLPFTIDGARLGPTSPAPMYGEHNQLLVDKFNVRHRELEMLRSLGVVSDTPRFGR